MADKFDENNGENIKEELTELTSEEREEIMRMIDNVDFDDDADSYAEEVVYGKTEVGKDALLKDEQSEDDHGIDVKKIDLEDYLKSTGEDSLIKLLEYGRGKYKKRYVKKNKAVKKLWETANIEQAEKELLRGKAVVEYTGEAARQIRYLPVHILAFAAPFMLMMAAFASINLYPFGDRQIMIIDSWHQYYPFLQELHSKLLSGESILYSWNGGAGTNFLTLMAYYASTPLYLLSVLFPREYLREFMMIITAVKIGLAGLFFSIYLRGIHTRDYLSDGGKNNKCALSTGFGVLGLSVSYALCAYATGYYWCLFFLNGMALLPLIILGLERLVDSGRFKLYAVTLGIALIANYYTAMFICFFIMAYYFVLYFAKLDERFSFGRFVKKSFQALAASLIGVGLAACILAPTILWFGNTGNYGTGFNRDIGTYNSLLDIFTNLLSGGAPNIRQMPPEGLPNIAAGIAGIIFAGLYFANKHIKIKDRLLYGGFIIFLALGFNLNILDYLWHGGHFPNEIPFRQSFVFPFILLTIAFKSYTAFKSGKKSVDLKTLGLFGLGFFAYILIAERLYQNTDMFGFEIFYISGALLAVYMLLLALFKYKKMSASMLAVFLMFMMMFEGGMSAVKGAAAAGSTDRDSYPMLGESVRAVIDHIYASDPGFYRLEMVRWWGTNDPMLYAYRGVSQFSSKANGRFTRMLQILGINAHPGGNKFLYASATPVANMFLSIKYLITRNGHDFLNSVAFDEYFRYYGDGGRLSAYPDVIAYRNRYWLPVAFMVSENINNADLTVRNPFIVQNDIMRQAAGIRGDVFRSMHPVMQNAAPNVNVDVTPGGGHGVYNFSTINFGTGTVNKRFRSDAEQQVYLYLRNPWHGGNKNATVRVFLPNGHSASQPVTAEADAGVTIDAGIVPAGGEIEISFEVQPGHGRFYLYGAAFDADVFREGFDILSGSVLEVSGFSDTRIEGSITVYEDGLFFASIPFDRGWRLRVNGERRVINPPSEAELLSAAIARQNGERIDQREVRTMRDGFITIPLEAGTHEIELYYITYGLIPGIIISVFSIALLILWDIIARVSRKRRDASIPEEEDHSFNHSSN